MTSDPKEIPDNLPELIPFRDQESAVDTARMVRRALDWEDTSDAIIGLYLGLLQRLPSADEVTTWLDAVEAGTERIDMVRAFIQSDEFRATQSAAIFSTATWIADYGDSSELSDAYIFTAPEGFGGRNAEHWLAVAGSFVGLLGRPPTTAEEAWALSALKIGYGRLSLARDLSRTIESTAYFIGFRPSARARIRHLFRCRFTSFPMAQQARGESVVSANLHGLRSSGI